MEEMPLPLGKERLSLHAEREQQKNSAIQMLQVFFSFFIKGQKKPVCYKMSLAFFFFVSGIFHFATERMKIFVLVI